MKVRILFTQETIGSGGVERRRLNLIKALDNNFYEIKIICTKTEGPLADEMRVSGAEVIEVGLLSRIWDISKYRAVLKVIKSFKPHIIHGAVFEGVLFATVSGSIGRVPIIIAEETSDPQNRSTKANYLLRAITSVADRVVAIAPNIGKYLKNVAKIPDSKIKVITNGVHKPREVIISEIAALKSTLGITQDDIVIGSVGRLFNDHKKFTDIIEAVSKLDQKKSIKILLIGDGPDKKLIRDYAEQLKLSSNLIMVGFQPDTAPFYKVMDIFCLASQREGFGLVAAEAMFHNLPVVATRVGGLQDIIIHDETGLLIEANKPDQVAAAINKLYYNRSLRETMGEKGKNRAELEYSAERYVREIEGMYNELLKSKQIL